MSKYIRNGAKVLFDYSIALVVFMIFIYIFMIIAKEKFNELLPIYCIGIFIITFYIIYLDMKNLATKEKKPQYEEKSYPMKGFVYGVIGFFPFALLESISVLIIFKDQFGDRIKHVFINILMGPLYFIIRFLGESPLSYILASLVIPLVAMLGYLAGYYGLEMSKLKKKANKPVAAKFTKSPWNPTNKATVKSTARKKKEIL